MLIIKPIKQNDVIDAIDLMDAFIFDPPPVGYDMNKAAWVTNFMLLWQNSRSDQEFLALGAFDDDSGELIGFITGATYVPMYCENPMADMKDCVTFPDSPYPQAEVFTKLFDAFLDHYYSIGVMTWRFDTIREEEDQQKLANFMKKYYSDRNDMETTISIRGHQLERDNDIQIPKET